MNYALPKDNLDDLGLLNDLARRRVYEFVTHHRKPVSRKQVAKAVEISRNLAAYHLDKLAEAGLLEVSFARVNGRGGPGAGRPEKLYKRSAREISFSIPPRNYDLLASIFATAVEKTPVPGFRDILSTAAAEQGELLGSQSATVQGALTAAGYEPAVDEDGHTVLHNCPFHSVVQDHTELVCTLNCAFIEGVLAGAGEDPARAELAPHEGHCCVVINPPS